MKRILIALLLLSTYSFAQFSVYKEVKLEMNYMVNGEKKTQSVAKWNNVAFGGIAVPLNNGRLMVRLNYNSDNLEPDYLFQIDTAYFRNNYTALPEKIKSPERIISFKFIPDKDSVSIATFKYMIFERKEVGKQNKTVYEVSQSEKKISTRLGEYFHLEFLDSDFPGFSGYSFRFIYDEYENWTQAYKNQMKSYLQTTYLYSSKDDIFKSIDSAQTGLPSLNIGIDYLRTNKKGEKLSIKKFAQPLTENYRSMLTPLKTKVYSGSLIFPFKLYNVQKEEAFSKSEETNGIQMYYEVILVPIAKTGNVYTADLYTSLHFWWSTFNYKKRIELTEGKPLKIQMDSVDVDRSFIYGGEDIYISLAKDYYDYVNEYFIITLEENKDK
jgi:hypothetical protein